MAKGTLARKVCVIGAGYTPLGDVRSTPEIKDFSEREMLSMACIEAMKNGNIEAKDIDAYYVGCSGPNLGKMKGAAPFFANWIGMKNKPTMFLDAGCVSGGIALSAAVTAIASGLYDAVLVTGVNINFSVPNGLRSLRRMTSTCSGKPTEWRVLRIRTMKSTTCTFTTAPR